MNMMERPGFVPAEEKKKSFSKEEEEFFASAPTTEYAPAQELEAAQQISDATSLTEAKAVLAVAEEDEVTEQNVIPLPTKQEEGFGEVADAFFKAGEEKYGTNESDDGPDDGARMAA